MLQALACANSTLAAGVGTHIGGYAFENATSAAACCAICKSDPKCDHFTFRTTDLGEAAFAEVLLPEDKQPCHLKSGTAAGKTFSCPECVSGGDGVTPSPPAPPPYPPPSPAPADAPNLLLLFPDEWRYDWAGFEYPHTSSPETAIPLKVPTIRALAARGTRFTQAYVPAPVCAPSRSCLAAGREYDQAGVPSNFANDFPTDQPTFYGLLRAGGYHTMSTGKDDLTKATQLGSKVNYRGCPSCVAGDGLYHSEALGFSDSLRYSGKMDVVDQQQPHEMHAPARTEPAVS